MRRADLDRADLDSADLDRDYLDSASTAPLRPAARAAMVEWLARCDTGDPGRIHADGMTTRVALEHARDEVASFFGARPREVVFTSGATESIAAAAWGTRQRGAHSVLTTTEHSAVTRWSAATSTFIDVDGDGLVDPDEMGAAVRDDTAVVHCQLVNHETGVCQPTERVLEAVGGRALVHIDAAQGAGRLPIAFSGSGIDLMSISAHKLGGPTGIGALLVRRGLRIDPLLVGGDQERARRAGMENTMGAIGFAAACRALVDRIESEALLQRDLSERLIAWVDAADGLELIGSRTSRAPHIVCLAVSDVEPQPVLLGLDALGISVHSGSSCSSEAFEPSPVLAAMGVDAQHSLRVSFGWSNTIDDVERLIAGLGRVLGELRSLRT